MTFYYDERDVSGYLARMNNCKQFRFMSLHPRWIPGAGDIEGFCYDEVVRQFHNPRVRSDGGIRIDWMLSAWEYAQAAADDHDLPTVTDILTIGAKVEPHFNTHGFRWENVYIGDSMGAPPALLHRVMPVLDQQVNVAPIQGRVGPHADEYRSDWSRFETLVKGVETADDWYLAYEAIHPFVDGNGRSGKILNCWLLGALSEPVLVDDYFNGGNP
jgi:hypothetical protein